MSFDDYAKHIYHKHRIAVALAIIKSKPTNVTTAEYLQQLTSRIDDRMDDDDITVCSDDFRKDDDDDDDMNDSVDILKEFDLNVGNENDIRADRISNYQGEEKTAECAKPINLPENLSQTTYYENSQNRFTPNTETQNDITFYEESVNEHIDLNECVSQTEINKTEDLNLKDTSLTRHKNHELGTGIRNPKIGASNGKHSENLDSTYYDSQKTVLYTVHGFTQNYTHYSPSQNDMIIPNKYIYGVGRHLNDVTAEKNINYDEVVQRKYADDCSQAKTINPNISDNKIHKNPQIVKELEFSQTVNVFSENNDDNFDQINRNSIHDIDKGDVSIKTATHTENHFEQDANIKDLPHYSQNIDEYFEEIQNLSEDEHLNSFPTKNNDRPNPQSTEMEFTNEISLFSQNSNDYSQKIYCTNKTDINIQKTDNLARINKNNENVTKNIENTDNHQEYSDYLTIKDNTDQIEEYKITEEESETREVISYKVLEEFNKVKTFLRRQHRRMSCDGYSTDSGYRSDSQIRSSNRSALQLSDTWLNQSGCCLFNYIMQSPLVASTRDITNEIALVLGQLIDKLHEEEKYPSFLEDLLETVDVLLRQVYNGASSGENEFLATDETLQRILLLNKSIHIQQHSIEKISNILEIFYNNITEEDSTYELTNINHIENISYIFHILEILLKKYLKNKENLVVSQSSTQQSQDEDRVFKKSSISDIWRKKWNPNSKIFEGSREKKCVLKMCSDVLNKIVVECVNGYSLVAYSALKCFNSMQN